MNLDAHPAKEVRTEAIELMGSMNNLSTSRNGEPILQLSRF